MVYFIYMNKKDKKIIIISLAFNIAILLLTIFGCVVLFTGFEFMPEEPLIESTKLGMFKFFTTDSNILMGVVSAVFIACEVAVLFGKRADIPKTAYIIKLVATSAVTLTFLVVFCYLSIVVNGRVDLLLKNSSVFFHLVNPVLAITTFVAFERTKKINLKHTIWSVLPTAAYGVFYITNVSMHVQNGKVSTDFDFYHLIQGGVWQAIFVVPLLLAITYGISVSLWFLNRNGGKKSNL